MERYENKNITKGRCETKENFNLEVLSVLFLWLKAKIAKGGTTLATLPHNPTFYIILSAENVLRKSQIQFGLFFGCRNFTGDFVLLFNL